MDSILLVNQIALWLFKWKRENKMKNTENKLKEYILGDIFCETPNKENDWDIFMNNKKK